MKRMKSKTLNKALIATTLSASILLGGAGAIIGAVKSSPLPVHALENNYNIQSSHGNTYYVAPDVQPGAGDGSEGNPFNIASILNDDSILAPGDTVLVKPGVYEQELRIRLQTKGGEYNNYITVKNADPTQKAVIDFSSQPFDGNNRGVQIDTDYWYWYGIDITGAGDNGMYIGGSYNVIENCEFYRNRDTGLQLGRSYGEYTRIEDWPSYNLIKNCTSYNNYDDETYGENADGFAAKLTVGYGNIFDGCIAYRNSDDGWDLYAKTDSGNIGAVIIYNCVAFENGFIAETQEEYHSHFPNYNRKFDEPNTNSYLTRDGDGNGFKLGGSVMEGDVYMYNCLSFNNRMHGVTDNSNPGVLSVKNVTAYNNSVGIDDDPTSDTFGQVVLSGDGVNTESKCGNINLARQVYSYNIMSNIVSVNHGITTVAADEYRGSAEYSYFDMVNGKSYKFEECIDASNRAEAYAKRGKSELAISQDIFASVPSTWTGSGANVSYSYALSGKENTTVHTTYRNSADGSINMGDMLRITDYSTLFGDEHKIGADLSKSSWDGYTHYSYYNASNANSKADAAVKASIATLDLNTNTAATFQDFDLLVAMEKVKITWQSSDTNTIAINLDTPVSASGTQDARAIVYRGSADKNVKLTATVTSTEDGSVSMTKEFNITVKADIPTIGDAVFEGVVDGRIILDQYDRVSEPEMSVRNAADYNGKLLDSSTYQIASKVTFATDKEKYPAEIHHFTTSVAGVYTVSKTVTLGEQIKNYSYLIYVASPTAQVNFVGEPAVIVNQKGYTIGGEVSSATGTLYSYWSRERVENITADKVMTEGKGYDFRDDNILFQFENDNNEGYYIYYVMCNLHGDVTSQVKEVQVTTQDITSVAEFKAALLDNNSSTIYMLKSDLDLSGETNWVSEVTHQKQSFKGVLNGLGHTISGLTVSASDNEEAALFYKLDGGTIENIKFHNFNISGKEKVGLIATTYGGYIYNVELRNVYVNGSARVGGLIGQATTGILYIDQVSFVNDARYEIEAVADSDAFSQNIYYLKDGDNYTVAATFDANATYYVRSMDIDGARSAAIVGFIQAGKDVEVTKTYISNCYVYAVIGNVSEQYVGSIVGSADDRNAKDYLEISCCYSEALLYSKTYCGGILGSHNKGTGVLRIDSCVFRGSLYYAQSVKASTEAVKNCSGIVGRYVATADAQVEGCYATFADHNGNFDVDNEPFSLGEVNLVTFWTLNTSFDLEGRWNLVRDPANENRAQAPYLTINFLGSWN